ncbi:MAG: hypothetical protein AAFX06_16280, partial [Planctomycetota bacterium]
FGDRALQGTEHFRGQSTSGDRALRGQSTSELAASSSGAESDFLRFGVDEQADLFNILPSLRPERFQPVGEFAAEAIASGLVTLLTPPDN